MTPPAPASSEIVLPPAAVRFRTSRSSGPGGQNVNKLDTRVEVIVDLDAMPALTESERGVIRQRLRSRLDRDGHLCVVSQRSRSQWQNRQTALERAAELIHDALTPRTPRVPTRPTSTSRHKRVESKRRRSGIKSNRRRPQGEDE